MRTNFRSVLIALLAVAAFGCSDPETRVTERAEPVTSAPAPAATAPVTQSAPASAGRPRIVFLGDSLTAGLGLDPPDFVSALIQTRLDDGGYRYEVVNAGLSGDTSAGGLSRLDWSLEGDVEVLVIELGANDGLRGLPPAQMKTNLDQIITRAKQRGIRVLLTGMEAPPNWGAAYTSEFRQVFRDLATEHDVAFLPFYLEGVAGVTKLNQRDGIHPNAEGSRIIEETVWQALEPMLGRPGR